MRLYNFLWEHFYQILTKILFTSYYHLVARFNRYKRSFWMSLRKRKNTYFLKLKLVSFPENWNACWKHLFFFNNHKWANRIASGVEWKWCSSSQDKNATVQYAGSCPLVKILQQNMQSWNFLLCTPRQCQCRNSVLFIGNSCLA